MHTSWEGGGSRPRPRRVVRCNVLAIDGVQRPPWVVSVSRDRRTKVRSLYTYMVIMPMSDIYNIFFLVVLSAQCAHKGWIKKAVVCYFDHLRVGTCCIVVQTIEYLAKNPTQDGAHLWLPHPGGFHINTLYQWHVKCAPAFLPHSCSHHTSIHYFRLVIR